MRKSSLIAILCLVPLTSGCIAVAGAGVVGVVGYVFYEKNEAQQDFEASFDKTWKATLEALKSLNYSVPQEPVHSADSGDIKLDDLSIHVARHPGNTTRVKVRVGTFDCEEHRRRAGLILEKIEAGL